MLNKALEFFNDDVKECLVLSFDKNWWNSAITISFFNLIIKVAYAYGHDIFWHTTSGRYILIIGNTVHNSVDVEELFIVAGENPKPTEL